MQGSTVIKPGFKLTEDTELLADPEYRKVMTIVEQLWSIDVIERAAGYCYSISDMVRTLLINEGIDCTVVECQLVMVRRSPPMMLTLGFDKKKETASEVNTHVVVITKTKIPLIIDLSIGHMQPDLVPFIVERANNINDTLATVNTGPATWLYTRKKHQQFPHLHQQNIVDRITTDQKVKRDIGWLRLMITVAVLVSLFNAARGTYDFYQVYIEDQNTWGPDIIQSLRDSITTIEQKLEPEQLRQRIEEAGYTLTPKK